MAKDFLVSAAAYVKADTEQEAIKFFLKSFPIPGNMLSVQELSQEEVASFFDNMGEAHASQAFKVDLKDN